jgi:hypothetical protein
MFFDALLSATTRTRYRDGTQLDEWYRVHGDRSFGRATGFELEQALSIRSHRDRRPLGFASHGSRSFRLTRHQLGVDLAHV